MNPTHPQTALNVLALCNALPVSALRSAAYAATGAGQPPAMSEKVPAYRGDSWTLPTVGDALLAGETAWRSQMVQDSIPWSDEMGQARYAFTVAVHMALGVEPPTPEAWRDD